MQFPHPPQAKSVQGRAGKKTGLRTKKEHHQAQKGLRWKGQVRHQSKKTEQKTNLHRHLRYLRQKKILRHTKKNEKSRNSSGVVPAPKSSPIFLEYYIDFMAFSFQPTAILANTPAFASMIVSMLLIVLLQSTVLQCSTFMSASYSSINTTTGNPSLPVLADK